MNSNCHPVGILCGVADQRASPLTNRLKQARAKHNLTQERLAEQVGVSRQSINSIEKNRYVPSTLLALKIACALDTDVHTLFELEESD